MCTQSDGILELKVNVLGSSPGNTHVFNFKQMNHAFGLSRTTPILKVKHMSICRMRASKKYINMSSCLEIGIVLDVKVALTFENPTL